MKFENRVRVHDLGTVQGTNVAKQQNSTRRQPPFYYSKKCYNLPTFQPIITKFDEDEAYVTY